MNEIAAANREIFRTHRTGDPAKGAITKIAYFDKNSIVRGAARAVRFYSVSLHGSLCENLLSFFFLLQNGTPYAVSAGVFIHQFDTMVLYQACE